MGSNPDEAFVNRTMDSLSDSSHRQEPSKPDCGLIELIHRGHDGWVCFARQRQTGDEMAWDNFLAAIPAAGIRQRWLPGMVSACESDAYFGIQGFARPGRGRSMAMGVNERRPSRRATNVKHLTACYADLDFRGATDEAFERFVGRLMLQRNKGLFPTPSVVMFSGQGVWLFWILANQYGNPVRAGELGSKTHRQSKNETWRACQRELLRRLRDFEPDANTMSDITRVCRIPGSVNSKSGRRVCYWESHSDDGQPITYGIRELASILQIRSMAEVAERVAYRRDRSKPVSTPHQNAWKSRWMRVVRVVEGLSDLRGGFRIGHRHNALLIMATALKTLGLDEAAIFNRALPILQRFSQAGEQYRPDEARRTIQKAMCCRGEKFNKSLKHQIIIDWLTITPDEQRELDFYPPKPDHEKRGAKRERRRAFIQAALDRGEHHSAEALTAMLNEAGHPCSQPTVERDLRAMRRSEETKMLNFKCEDR